MVSDAPVVAIAKILTIVRHRLSEGRSDANDSCQKNILEAREQVESGVLGVLDVRLFLVQHGGDEPRVGLILLKHPCEYLVTYQLSCRTDRYATPCMRTQRPIWPRSGVRTLRETRLAVGLLRQSVG